MIGSLRAALPVRSTAPDRVHNNWPWIVAGVFGGLGVHASFDFWSSRLLAVAGGAVGLLVARILERRIVRVAVRRPGWRRRALGLTDTHLIVFTRPGLGGSVEGVVASAPLDHVETIRVENGGWGWLTWLAAAASAAVVVASEFVMFSPSLLLLGVVISAVVAATVGSEVSSDVYVLLRDGRQWKLGVRPSEWLRFQPFIPGLKWRGSGDGTRIREDALAGI